MTFFEWRIDVAHVRERKTTLSSTRHVIVYSHWGRIQPSFIAHVHHPLKERIRVFETLQHEINHVEQSLPSTSRLKNIVHTKNIEPSVSAQSLEIHHRVEVKMNTIRAIDRVFSSAVAEKLLWFVESMHQWSMFRYAKRKEGEFSIDDGAHRSLHLCQRRERRRGKMFKVRCFFVEIQLYETIFSQLNLVSLLPGLFRVCQCQKLMGMSDLQALLSIWTDFNVSIWR